MVILSVVNVSGIVEFILYLFCVMASQMETTNQKKSQQDVNPASKFPTPKENTNQQLEKQAKLQPAPEALIYQEEIEKLQDKLKDEQKKSKKLRATRADLYGAKSGLEEFFLQCVDETRKQLQKNKYAPLVENVLASEETLVYLYETLFPHRAGLPEKLRVAAQPDQQAEVKIT